MFVVLGVSIGFWGLYCLIASFSKHETALIVTGLLGFLGGLGAALVRGVYETLLGSTLAVVLIFSIAPLQVKSWRKEEWKKSRQKKLEKKEAAKTEYANQLKEAYTTESETFNEIEQESLESSNICPSCKNEIKPGALFCNHCGAKLNGEEIKPQTISKKDSEHRDKVFSSNIKEKAKKIRIFEIVLCVCAILFVVTLIAFPTATSISNKNAIAVENYQTVLLKNLDQYNKTYMQEVQRGNSVQYIVYQKVNGEVNCYAFTKSTKSTTKGFASKSDIVDYFSDLTISEPPASFLSPGLFACSIAFPTLSLAGAVIAIVLFKVNEKNLYIMIKRNKSTTIQVSKNVRELERKHEEGLITEKDYLRAKKEILLETIGNKIKFIL